VSATQLPPVHCLMGPTGAGKTALALWLAERLPIEIVSVDSALVYRGMDIGTAKPDPGARRRVLHHLIDLCPPDEPYSVARFCSDAAAAVADIESRGRVPLLVGGTGLYLRRFETGIADMPPVPPDVHAQLQAALAGAGAPALHARLAAVDADSAARIRWVFLRPAAGPCRRFSRQRRPVWRDASANGCWHHRSATGCAGCGPRAFIRCSIVASSMKWRACGRRRD